MPTFQLLHGERTDAQDLELLGRLMVSAWRTDGAFFVAINEELVQLLGEAFSTSKDFMDQSLASKKRCVSELSFSGYFSGLEYDVHPTDVVTTAKTPSVGGAAAAAPPSNNTGHLNPIIKPEFYAERV
jgi:isopenicillin N synthase-like dioxygenase